MQWHRKKSAILETDGCTSGRVAGCAWDGAEQDIAFGS